MTDPTRLALSERLGEYFELQAMLGQRMAELTATPLAQAMSRYTNLQRRFSLGDLSAPADQERWAGFIDGLEQLSTGPERRAWTVAFHAQSPEEVWPIGRPGFGCFSCEPPNEEGVLRFHFFNREGLEEGPLSRARIPARRAELVAMFGFIRGAYPQARSVMGSSWLYNTEAYRRLFPPEYGASRALLEAPVRLSGTSTWGQLQRHTGAVKPEARRHFLAALELLDPAAPWKVFPLRALRTTAPIGAFHDFYDG